MVEDLYLLLALNRHFLSFGSKLKMPSQEEYQQIGEELGLIPTPEQRREENKQTDSKMDAILRRFLDRHQEAAPPPKIEIDKIGQLDALINRFEKELVDTRYTNALPPSLTREKFDALLLLSKHAVSAARINNS